MTEANQNTTTLIAIIAIVAIVAMVVLALNNIMLMKSAANDLSEDENFAGEGIRLVKAEAKSTEILGNEAGQAYIWSD